MILRAKHIVWLLLLCTTAQYAMGNSVVDKKKKKKKNATAPAVSNTATKLSAKDIEENAYFFEAQRLKCLNDNKSAIEIFEKVLEVNPQNHAAMFELSRLYFVMQNDDKALKNIENAIKFMPDNLWYNLVYAQILSITNKPKEAIKIYDKILVLEPREQAYYYDKAGLLENAGDIEKAIDFYNEIERVFGIDPYCSEQKKRLYLSINKTDNAIAEIKKLIDSDSSNIEYLHMLANVYNANKMTDKAIQVYKQIINKDAEYAPALLSLADYYYKNNEKKKALEYTNRAFNGNSISIDNKVKILYQYIQFYESNKADINDAYTLAASLRKTHPTDAKSYAISADLYYVDGNDSTALYFYEQSLTYKKDVYSVWQQLLLLCSEQQKTDKLKMYSEEAIELFPTQPLVYYFNGIAMSQLKRYRDAVTMMQEAYKFAGTNSMLKTQIFASLGDSYHEIGNNTLSDSCYEAALQLDPKNAYTLNNYAYFLSLRKEKLTKAKEYIEMAIRLDASNPSYYDTYAWILFQMQDYTKAEEQQLNALRISDLSDPTLFEHYGDILFKIGKLEDANKAWNKALEKGGSSPLLLKKIKDKTWYESLP